VTDALTDTGHLEHAYRLPEPGYRTVRVAPRPGGGITWADTELDSPHGRISVNWRLAPNGRLDVQLTLPEGVTAEIDLPGAPLQHVGHGRQHFTSVSAPTC